MAMITLWWLQCLGYSRETCSTRVRTWTWVWTWVHFCWTL